MLFQTSLNRHNARASIQKGGHPGYHREHQDLRWGQTQQGLRAALSGVKVDNPDHQVLSVSVETFSEY